MVSYCVQEKFSHVFSKAVRPETIEEYNNVIILYPPNKITQKYYRCDNVFHLTSLLEMYKPAIKYGICLISGKEYKFYLLEIRGSHTDFKLLCSDSQEIMNQHKSGGQSAVRFQRLRDIQIDHYIKKISEFMCKTYLINNNTQLIIKGIIIAGPGSIKNDVMQTELFKQYFSDKLLQTATTSEINNNTVYDIYEKYYNILQTSENIKNKQIVDNLKNLLLNNFDVIVFGYDEIIENINTKNLKSIIISNTIDNNIKKEIYNSLTYKCEIIEMDENFVSNYGGLIGIKWY